VIQRYGRRSGSGLGCSVGAEFTVVVGKVTRSSDAGSVTEADVWNPFHAQ
jgi:hypothetical protein